MTITVGTDTYITLADARTYAAKVGLTLPVVDADAEALLKKATIALDRIYGNRYLGQKADAAQPLYWPREFATSKPHYEGEWWYVTYDSDGNPADLSGYPAALGQAEVELAVLIGNGTNVYAQPGPVVSAETKKVASLEKSVTYAGNGSRGYQTDPIYNVSLILRPLLVSYSGISITRGA